MAESSTHILRVVLQGGEAIYRDIEIESGRSLYDLAEGIVHAFDFMFDHAFGFYSQLTGADVLRDQPKFELFADMGERDDSGSVMQTQVAEAFHGIGHTMLLLFDYGDDWRFTVEVIGVGQRKPKTRYPKVLATVGTAPEQYADWDEDEDDEEE